MLGTYLDHNATTPLHDGVRAAMAGALGPPANPSSVHGFGQQARLLVEEARQSLAARTGARPEEVVFTSGGTEANAMALQRPCRALAVSAIEHVAVLDAAPSAHRLPVDADGVLDLGALREWLRQQGGGKEEGSIGIALMLANNETGVVQPVAEAAALAAEHDAWLHCDAVQGLGKIPVDFAALGVDSMALSAHKIGGPTGVGALILKEGVAAHPLVRGGGQEKNRRPGTENVAGIVGFGAAAALADPDAFEAHCLPLRQGLEERLVAAAPDAVVFGRDTGRLANTTCIAMPGRAAETQVMALDLEGVAVSAGAACSSGKVKSSHVLEAMEAGPHPPGGAGGLAGCAIRVSTGLATSQADIDRLAEAWVGLYKRG